MDATTVRDRLPDAAPPAARTPRAAVKVGVAIGIPEPWGSQLDRSRAATGDPLAPFVPAHVTLLGPTEVAAEALPSIERHLEQVAGEHQPYTVGLRGTGTFRPITEVVFVAVASGISQCEQLASAVRSGPLDRELHFPYHPHVTVAHDIPTEALDAVFEELADFTAQFPVNHFTLHVHGADGRWRPLRDFPLGPGGAPGRAG